MMGTFVGIAFTKSEHAVQILPIIIVPFVIFGGLIVNLDDIPAYANWMQYGSPMRHSYSCLMLDQLSTSKMHNLADNEDIRKMVGIHGTFGLNLIYLAASLFIVNAASLALLFYKRKVI